MGRKEYENVEHNAGPNSDKYHSRSASYKQEQKGKEQNGKEKFKTTNS